MRVDEQNELQEGGHAGSFFGFMCLEVIATIRSAGAHASRVLSSASRGWLVCRRHGCGVNESGKRQSGDGFRRDAKISTRDACGPLLLALTFFSFSAVLAQVSGDSSDLAVGLVAKWEGVMPLDTEKTLYLPDSTQGMMLEDFAVALAFRVEKQPDAEHGSHILALINESQAGLLDWHLGTKGFSITLEGRGVGHPVAMASPLHGRWWHVVLNVKRDQRQAQSGIWVNGVELNSWREGAGPVVLAKALFDPCSRGLGGDIANLRFYNRALTRPEILELAALPPMTGEKPKLVPFSNLMQLMTGEVVAILGGTEAVAVMEDGTLEALLLTQFPGSRVKVRDLSWEADTVFRQDRPMNFGSLPQQLKRAGATAGVLMFGRQECLERGVAGLNEFKAALENMVATCANVTPRLVLAEPLAFAGELSKHNATLKKYAEVIKAVAQAHGALFAAQDGDLQPGATRDGLNLTAVGAAQLGKRVSQLWGDEVKAPNARLKALIGQKNMLWHRYWRPANWAFLHGDRTAQPSSRDHVDPTQRWFPSELEQYQPLIEAKENEIWTMANDLGGKLP